VTYTMGIPALPVGYPWGKQCVPIEINTATSTGVLLAWALPRGDIGGISASLQHVSRINIDYYNSVGVRVGSGHDDGGRQAADVHADAAERRRTLLGTSRSRPRADHQRTDRLRLLRLRRLLLILHHSHTRTHALTVT